jgi:hypothetical protein
MTNILFCHLNNVKYNGFSSLIINSLTISPFSFFFLSFFFFFLNSPFSCKFRIM